MASEESLDPENWEKFRILGHKMLDDMLDYLRDIRKQPVWRPIPNDVKLKFKALLPKEGQTREKIYEEFKENILPYPLGNPHPRFWGWAVGNGTPFGLLAEMLAATMNPNVGGGEHIANYVENQVIDWAKDILGYDPNASGILVSGASIANFIGLAVARNKMAGYDIKKEGLRASKKDLLIYGSEEMHNSIDKAVFLLGLGINSLRKIPVNDKYEIRIDKLKETIEADLTAGFKPTCIIGCAGTINTGAIDNLNKLADLSDEFNIWFHVDGAFGAWCKLSPEVKDLVNGIERADSIAFDFHKWMYINFEAGCALIRNREDHFGTFNLMADYIAHQDRGVASGDIWYGLYGPQLSRGFRALKIWMSIKEHGANKYGRIIHQNIRQARYLTNLIENEDHLELLAPTSLNIVNFRYNDGKSNEKNLNKLNEEILFHLQENGIAVPSSTTINGNFAIRVAIVNYRSKKKDFDMLINSVLNICKKL
ncbi:MAG: amino acid decarboxylase [Promethearchaeota archaeon]|nr:MAG: amino acid decarboxylase [Candidatus Lokiarchaeota archaeon]